jgi:hypothetical protein
MRTELALLETSLRREFCEKLTGSQFASACERALDASARENKKGATLSMVSGRAAFLFKYYCVGEFNRKETILYDRMEFLSRAIFT